MLRTTLQLHHQQIAGLFLECNPGDVGQQVRLGRVRKLSVKDLGYEVYNTVFTIKENNKRNGVSVPGQRHQPCNNKRTTRREKVDKSIQNLMMLVSRNTPYSAPMNRKMSTRIARLVLYSIVNPVRGCSWCRPSHIPASFDWRFCSWTFPTPLGYAGGVCSYNRHLSVVMQKNWL